MVLIGMPVKIKVFRKQGEKYKPLVSYKDAIVVERHTNFVVVQYKSGYKECFRESEIVVC